MRRQASRGRLIALALVFLGLHTATAIGNASSTATPEVCESRTINYITHTLPQQCFRTSWTAAVTATPATTAAITVEATATASQNPEATPLNETQESEKGKSKDEVDSQDFATGSFMSFEEWKEMMLRKSGQDPAKLKDRKPHEHRERDPSMANGEFDSIGEEGEIDFDALADKVSELASPASGEPTPHSAADLEEQHSSYEDSVAQYSRSKDAGKTCKERFSFSSFDAGATVLKTSPGAKNSKAILVENKDSYMLLECRTKNKFVIVELSDDILVDTVVLANFEFFSSMIRKFRVSVSDRYPVKIDKWVDLGTFEARNTRDIQPFLVEHPQIYTKYIRIEFLTHYGNEYYCPVSLLRVHGTRMLDTWKEQDSSRDDEMEQIDGAPPQESVGNVLEAAVVPEPGTANETGSSGPDAGYVVEMGLSPWQPMFYYNFSEETCVLRSPTTGEPTPVSSHVDSKRVVSADHHESIVVPSSHATPVPEHHRSTESPSAAAASPKSGLPQSKPTGVSSPAGFSPSQQPPSAGNGNGSADSSNSRHAGARTDSSADSNSSRNTGTATSSTATTSRNKTSVSSSAASASPTVQESFFKTVTKRLQLLESNTSLSLQYIEEQSRFLQEALLKMEKKQASRVDTFLDTLNQTVLAELRTVRTQYDQIWQSTVIALETQREQSQREIVALSARLAVLADEVVFQKRMAILQSVLLLSCLVLVIFSRGGGSASSVSTRAFDHFSSHIRQDSGAPTFMSPSPPPSGVNSHHHGYHADKTLPMTPTSQFSREGTPLIHVGGVEVPFPGDPSPSPLQLNRRRNRTTQEGAEEEGNEDANEEGAPQKSLGGQGTLRDEQRHTSQARFGDMIAVELEPARSLGKGRSGLPQVGSARKPLPALPEHPS